MIKGIFVDFYGTIVQEDKELFREIVSLISKDCKSYTRAEIGSFWGKEHQRAFNNAYGTKFETQRVLEKKALENTINMFHSNANVDELCQMMFERWIRPPIFDESILFFENRPVPIYIVSNIDTSDINEAIKYHNLSPDGVFTSEDAKAYKPRKEPFELALNVSGLNINEVIHIGDSITCDINGASALGIKSLFINRYNTTLPTDIVSITDLLEAYRYIDNV